MIDKKFYLRALNAACIKNDYCYIEKGLGKPFMRDGMAVATDGMVLVFVKGFKVEYEEIKQPQVNKFYQPHTEVLGYIDFSHHPEADAIYKYGKVTIGGKVLRQVYDVACMLGCRFGKVVAGADDKTLSVLLDNNNVFVVAMGRHVGKKDIVNHRELIKDYQDTQADEARAEIFYHDHYLPRLEAKKKADEQLKVYEVEVTVRKTIYIEAEYKGQAEEDAVEYVYDNDLLDDYDCYVNEVSLETLAKYHKYGKIVVDGCEIDVPTYLAGRAEEDEE